MVDIPQIATGVVRTPEGVWVAGDSDRSISYPSDGNDACFAIEESSFWFRHRNRVIIETVRRLPPNGPILDVGGGNGYQARALELAGFPTILIEPNETGARNARGRGVANVICATVEQAGIVPGSMGGVGLFDVIEHIEDDRGFLERLRPVLRSGGRVYVTVPAYQALWSVDDTAAGHYRRYTIASLRRVLASAGLTVEFCSYFFSVLPLPVFLLRTIPTRLGLRREVTAEVMASEHTGGGAAGRLAERFFSSELALLRRGRSLPFGGSILAVARTA
jgi:SAM-dependent methyltransferase